MSKEKFDEILRSRLQSFEKTPPPGAFDKIKAKLEAPVEEEKPAFILPAFAKYGIAASVAFLFGLIAMNTYWQNTTQNSIVSDANANPSENIENTILSPERNTTTTEQEEELVATVNASESNSGLVNKLKAKVQTNVNAVASSMQSLNNNNQVAISASSKQNDEDHFLFRSDKVVVNVAGVYASNKSHDPDNISVYALADFQNEIDNGTSVVKVDDEYGNTRFETNISNSGYQGFWFGPNISFQSQGISGHHLVGNGLGVDLGYDLSKKIGLQSGLRFNMLLKDFELLDSDGNTYHELANFSNVSVPLSLKFKKSYFAPKVERPVSLNTYIGADYARMLLIGKNQMGAHLGMEYDIFLRPEMFVTIGARAGLSSILNYNPTEEYLQGNYRRFNYNLGIYASLRFISPTR